VRYVLAGSFTASVSCFLREWILPLKPATFVIGLLVILEIMTVSLALDISLDGIWSLTIDSSDLVSGAGSDLVTQYESASDQVLLEISNSAGGGDLWRVDVSRSDISWNGDLTISCKRTSSGSGGSVSGGLSYQDITGSDQEFFTGSDDVVDISIQYLLDGVSITIPPDLYSTTVVYTVVDI
jgi:hypothetical protein